MTGDDAPKDRTALVVRGGWDGHQPVETTELFIPFLEANGFSVRVEESPAVYADDTYMATVDLIMQVNTMNTIEKEEMAGLHAAVVNGTGMGGWHGGIADSYRDNADYLHMIGGQFAITPARLPTSAPASSPTTTSRTRSASRSWGRRTRSPRASLTSTS